MGMIKNKKINTQQSEHMPSVLKHLMLLSPKQIKEMAVKQEKKKKEEKLLFKSHLCIFFQT